MMDNEKPREFLPNLVSPEAPLTIRLEAARALLFLYDCLTPSENTEVKYRIKAIRQRGESQ